MLILCFFFDLKKAFDTVDHDILLSKMNLYGIHETSLGWVFVVFNYRVARNFCGSLFLRIGDFLCFTGTNFCD